MTELISVSTVFGHTVEVDHAEAAALERAGLVRHDDTPPVESPAPVTVTPVFTGQPIDVPADEAAALDREGLLVHDDVTVPPQRQDDNHEPDGKSAEQENA